MSTIYLVRHCQYENPRDILPGRLPVELSQEGLKEANLLKDFFKEKNIATIFSSGVLRCKQTAQIISDNAIPIKYDQRLLETFFAYQGFWRNDPQECYVHVEELGGESRADVLARMKKFWESLEFDSKENYLICSHGDPLYFLYQFLSGSPLLTEEDEYPPSDYQPKGSIRPVVIKSKKEFVVQEMIVQKEL